jgi:hypothetical protein
MRGASSPGAAAGRVSAEDQIVMESSRLFEDRTARWLGDVDDARAVVLGLSFSAEPAVHLALQLVLVAVQQRVAGGKDLPRPHAGVGGPRDHRRNLRAEPVAMHAPRDRDQLVELGYGENRDVLTTSALVQAESCERILVNEVIFERIGEHRPQGVDRAGVRAGPRASFVAREIAQQVVGEHTPEACDALSVVLSRGAATQPTTVAASIVIGPATCE